MKRISGIYRVFKDDIETYYCFKYKDSHGKSCLFLNAMDKNRPGNGWKDYMDVSGQTTDEGLATRLKLKDGPFPPEKFRDWARLYDKQFPSLGMVKLLFEK